MGKDGTGRRREGAQDFLLPWQYLFAIFYFKDGTGWGLHWLLQRGLWKVPGKSFMKVFSQYIVKYLSKCVCGERWMARGAQRKGEAPHTPGAPPVLLKGQRCPSRFLDWVLCHGACEDCPADTWAGKPCMKMDVVSPSLWAPRNTSLELKECIFLSGFEVDYLPTWHSWALRVLLWMSALYLAL